jgi:MFS transporter, DHA2 family, multidrug resistance protein
MSSLTQHAEAPVLKRRLILATTMFAASMYSLDLTVVSLALPHMQGTFSATPDQIAWVVTGFIVGATATITLVGWLVGLLGRRTVFAAAIAIYMVMAVLSANTSSLEEMVLWRLFAGLTGAAIIPVSQVVAVDAYPREQYGRALTLWGVGSVVGSIIAPPLAGLIIDAYGWHAVFYMNLPLGSLALFGCLAFVPARTSDQARKLDWFGLVTLIVGIGALQLMFNRGARLDWFGSTEIIVEVILGATCLYLFVAHSATTRDPYLKTEPFRNWNYSLGLLCALIYGTLWPLPMVLYPLLLQNFRGLPVEMIGILMVPRQLGYMVGSMAMGPALARLNHKAIAVSGFLGIAFSSWLMSRWSLDVGYWAIGWAALFQGIACAAAFNPLNTLAFSTLPAADRQQSVPLFYLTINLGSSIGVAGTITFWAEETTRMRAALVEHVSPFNPLLQRPELREAWDLATASGRSALDRELIRQAGMIGFNDTFATMLGVALIGAVFALAFKRVRR